MSGVKRTGGRRAAKFDQRADALTAENLRAAIEPILRKGRHDFPDYVALITMAAELADCRAKFYFLGERARKLIADNSMFAEAISTILQGLNGDRRNNIENMISRFEEKTASQDRSGGSNKDELVALAAKALAENLKRYQLAREIGDRARNALEALQANENWVQGIPKDWPSLPDSWTDILNEIKDITLRGMPHIGGGTTRGTLNQVLAAVIPSITGENPTPEAIDSWRRGKG